MPEIRPAQFPRIPRSQAGLYNLVLTRRPVLAFDSAGELINLRFGPALDRSGVSSALTADSGSAWLTLDPTLLERWLAPWIGGEGLAHLPPALRNAACHAALTPLFTALDATTGIVFTLNRSPAPPPESAARLGLWPMDTSDGNPKAVLHLDEAATAALTTRFERLPVAEVEREPWPALPVSVTLWIGQIHLALREFRRLETGDILLLTPAAPGAAPELILRQSGRPLGVARLQGRQLLIDRLVQTAMPESSQAPDTVRSPLDPDDLEIRIDFDLGCLTLPLRELRTIQPGYSFNLDRPDARSVRIVAGSQLIGYGELVQVDDRLGVRVTSLFQSPE